MARATGGVAARRLPPPPPLSALLLLAVLFALVAHPAAGAPGLVQELYSLGTVTSLPLPLSGQTPTSTAIVTSLNCPSVADCFPAPQQGVWTGKQAVRAGRQAGRMSQQAVHACFAWSHAQTEAP